MAARALDDASNEYLEWSGAGPPVTAPPFTISCWAKTDDKIVEQTLVWIGDKDSPDAVLWAVGFLAESSTDKHAFARSVSGAVVGHVDIGEYFPGTWQHVCGIFYSDDWRRILLDGQLGDDGTSITGISADRVAIGRAGGSTPGTYLSGSVADVAIWNTSLNQPEWEALAAGFSAQQIKPKNLVAYWPLGGLHGRSDNDLLGAHGMTAYNAPSWTDHPPLVYPGRPRSIAPVAQAGPGGDPPYYNAAGQVWHTGAQAGGQYVAGQHAGQVFTNGPLAGQIHG